jgi:hypothetical protein
MEGKMPKLCTICTSQYRQEIDILIVNETPIRVIAARFSLSRSAVGRHRVTCHQAIVASTLEDSKAAELLESIKEAEGSEAGVTSLTRAAEMFRRCRTASNLAFKRGDLKTGFLGVREGRACLELMARLNGEFSNPEPAREVQPMFTFTDPFTHMHFGAVDEQINCRLCRARKILEELEAKEAADRTALPPTGEIEATLPTLEEEEDEPLYGRRPVQKTYHLP